MANAAGLPHHNKSIGACHWKEDEDEEIDGGEDPSGAEPQSTGGRRKKRKNYHAMATGKAGGENQKAGARQGNCDVLFSLMANGDEAATQTQQPPGKPRPAKRKRKPKPTAKKKKKRTPSGKSFFLLVASSLAPFW